MNGQDEALLQQFAQKRLMTLASTHNNENGEKPDHTANSVAHVT